MVRNQGKVTRFVVMAVLQAALAESLGLSHASALSWGLNRAIFYAAAKQGFRGAPKTGWRGEGPGAADPTPEVYRLGGDEAYHDSRARELTFTIGGQLQTVERFEEQVAARFGTMENFRVAWAEATRLIDGFDRATLESPERFYSEVYRPGETNCSDRWNLKYSPAPKRR